MICGKCAANISGQDTYEHAGLLLCEDCYIAAVSSPRTCDPWAVYAATRTTPQGETLTPDQKRILEVIQKNGPVSLEQICRELSLTEEMFRSSFSTLRHMELAQACKQGDQVFYIAFRKKAS